MTHNEIYVGHRTGCEKCFGVDVFLGGTRCEQGKILVRAAAAESKWKRLRKIMASDFVFLRQVGISFP